MKWCCSCRQIVSWGVLDQALSSPSGDRAVRARMVVRVHQEEASVLASSSQLSGLMSPWLKITVLAPHGLWFERDPETPHAPHLPKWREVCGDSVGLQTPGFELQKEQRGKLYERQCSWQDPHERLCRLALCKEPTEGLCSCDLAPLLPAELCPRCTTVSTCRRNFSPI